METKKKVIIIITTILIIVGIIIVAVKGFNVSLYLKEHATLEFVFDQTFEKKDVKEICEEVFGDKKFDVRTVEVFDDSVYIISETITEEEQEQLLEKLSSLYSEEELDTSDEEVSTNILTDSTDVAVDTETTTEYDTDDETSTDEEEAIEETLEEGVDYEIYYDSNVDLFDLLKPYIIPSIVAAIIIILCMMVRYKLLKSEKVIKKTLIVIVEAIVLIFVLLSLIAIFRIPVNTWVLPFLMFFVLFYIVAKFEMEIRKKSDKIERDKENEEK